MICFKIRIFALRQTSQYAIDVIDSLLWFALKFVSLRLDKHLNPQTPPREVVVICFKIRIFALRQTSSCLSFNIICSLWFALKFVSLRLDKHQTDKSNIGLSVVICFKIRIFALRQTSKPTNRTSACRLWFALKFVSLRLDKHPSMLAFNCSNCCDLL